MEIPELPIYIRHDTEKDLLELYGVKFKYKEGSIKGFLPLKELAEKINMSIENLNEILIDKTLLDKDGCISENTCMHNFGGKEHDTIKYAFFVLSHVYTMPEGADIRTIENKDLIDGGIYGHEQFIADLVNKERLKIDIHKTIREVTDALNVDDNPKEIEKLKKLDKFLVYNERGICPFCKCRPIWMPGGYRKF